MAWRADQQAEPLTVTTAPARPAVCPCAAQLFDPFNQRNAFQPSGVSYPAEGEGGSPSVLPTRLRANGKS